MMISDAGVVVVRAAGVISLAELSDVVRF